jgi:hypothetical protein
VYEREENRVRVFENGAEKNYLGLKGAREQENEGKCIMKSCMLCMSHQILSGLSNQEEGDLEWHIS